LPERVPWESWEESLGCGVVIGGREAHFVPMHTDAAGRWTGL
jgi:hypothetical protein